MVLEDPLWQDGNDYPARLDRQFIEDVFDVEGVIKPAGGALKVSPRAAGANMSVDVAAGRAVVRGDDEANQGHYRVISTAVENLPVGAAPGSDSRIDLIVARVRDAAVTGGVSSDWLLEVIPGAVAAAPVAPAVPPTAIPLAEVLVAAGTVSIDAAKITDRRTAAANAAYVAKAGDSISGDLAVAGLLTARSGGTTGEALRIGNDASFWDIDETSMIAVRKADGTAAGTAAGLVADKGFRSSGMRISGGFVGAEESTTSTTYTNLTTVGAEYTFTGPPSGMVLVALMARTRNGDAGGSTLTSFELVRNSDNVITEAATDARAFQVNGSTFASGVVMDRVGVTAGVSYTARMKYRASNTVNSVGYWRDRRLLVIPSL
jgi:hypothetical protein